MNPALTEAIKEAYALAPTDKVIIDTLELRHPSIVDSIFITSQRADVEATLEDGLTVVTFKATGFRFQLPAPTASGAGSLNITIDNVDREVTDFINLVKNTQAPIEVYYRPYLSNDLTTPQMDPPLKLSLHVVSVGAFQIVGTAKFMDVVNSKFPVEYYTRERFPSLGR